MWLTFDIGNSAIKGGAFDEGRMHHVFSLPHDPGGMEAGLDEAINRVRTAGNPVDRTGIASVVPDSAACLTRLLQDRGHTPVQIRSTMRLPFRLDAASPETLGVDRLAAAAAAWVEYGKSSENGIPRHVIVIDAGSAVTCEVVHRSGVYAGGTIGPGPELALSALHRDTAQLPRRCSRVAAHACRPVDDRGHAIRNHVRIRGGRTRAPPPNPGNLAGGGFCGCHRRMESPARRTGAGD